MITACCLYISFYLPKAIASYPIDLTTNPEAGLSNTFYGWRSWGEPGDGIVCLRLCGYKVMIPKFKPTSLWFQNHAFNCATIQLPVWNACVIHLTRRFDKGNHLLPLASWAHKHSFPAITGFIYSWTHFLDCIPNDLCSLFYYIIDSKALKVFREQ